MLRRSPLLLGILLAYPVAIALLVGLVAGYANSKPRVALVDEDNLPATVVIGGKRFHVDRTIDRSSQNVKLVRLSPEDAHRQLRTGKVVAVVTVPPGLHRDAEGDGAQPEARARSSRTARSHRGSSSRSRRSSTRSTASSSAPTSTNNLKYVTLILNGGNGTFLGQPIDVLGLERSERVLDAMPARRRVRRLEDFHPRRPARARQHRGRPAPTAHPIELAARRARRTWVLSAQVQAYALGADDHLPRARCSRPGSLAAERDENVIGRLARGLVGLGQLVWAKVALAAAVALALGLAIVARFRGGHRHRRRDGRRALAAAAAARGRARARGRRARRAGVAARRSRAGGALGLARRAPRRAPDRLPRPDPAPRSCRRPAGRATCSRSPTRSASSAPRSTT